MSRLILSNDAGDPLNRCTPQIRANPRSIEIQISTHMINQGIRGLFIRSSDQHCKFQILSPCLPGYLMPLTPPPWVWLSISLRNNFFELALSKSLLTSTHIYLCLKTLHQSSITSSRLFIVFLLYTLCRKPMRVLGRPELAACRR